MFYFNLKTRKITAKNMQWKVNLLFSLSWFWKLIIYSLSINITFFEWRRRKWKHLNEMWASSLANIAQVFTKTYTLWDACGLNNFSLRRKKKMNVKKNVKNECKHYLRLRRMKILFLALMQDEKFHRKIPSVMLWKMKSGERMKKGQIELTFR